MVLLGQCRLIVRLSAHLKVQRRIWRFNHLQTKTLILSQNWGLTNQIAKALWSMIKSGLLRGRAMSVEAMVQGMIDMMNEALVDAAKHDKGNSAAGTRVRKAMQAIKGGAQDVRVKVQADKNA